MSLKIKSTMILNSNKNNPKLTIGMSIYNGEKFILKKLENILSQTFQDFELIISDDSTDNTPKICKDFAFYNLLIIILYFTHERR